MRNYSVIKVGGRLHVVCSSPIRGQHQEPNYKGTGLALCGVVDNGKNLNHWLKKHKARLERKENLINESTIKENV